MTTVLISEPNASTMQSYLPYVWGLLKTAAEQDPDLKRQISWFDPICRRDTADRLIADYDPPNVDVLGLSCYTWNFDLQCDIAAYMKAANPRCITVVGGPHPQVKDPDFFRKHRYFDVVVSKDGEATFNALLHAINCGERDFREIPGLYLPDGDSRDMLCTGTPRTPKDFSVSPYIAQSDYYSRLLLDQPSAHFAAVWETNRGCPYSCAYCDWGSNTMSKIRQFPLDRVYAEIDWLHARKLSLIMMVDANFGILPRDTDIATHFAAGSKAAGNPGIFYFSAAKNNPARSLEISRILLHHAVRFQPSLAIQHTDIDVLTSVDRKNISPQKQYDVAKELRKLGACIDVQLIMGMPGDSFDRWKASLAQLLLWGLHDDYSIFFFNFLPNAPAADAAYRDFWQIQTIKRVVRDPSAGLRSPVDNGIIQEITVGSKVFTPAEWVEMNAYTSIFRALHGGGLTRLVAIAMHATCGISFTTFYDAVVGDYLRHIFKGGEIHAYTHDIYDKFLTVESTVGEQTTVPELGDDAIMLHVAHAVLVRLAIHADAFFDGLGDFLRQRFGGVCETLLMSLLDYQRNMLILPDYDPAHGKMFPLTHDWPSYFADIGSSEMTEARDPPQAIAARNVFVEEAFQDKGFYIRHVDWVGSDTAEKWYKWVSFSLGLGMKVNAILHEDIRLVPAQSPSRTGAFGLSAHLGRVKAWLVG